MRNDLAPSGAALLAVALLSRGFATAPRALVAYALPTPASSEGPPECVTHEVNLATGARFYGHYGLDPETALLDFTTRLEKDRHYLEGGIALTEASWLSAKTTSTPEGA